MLDKLEFYQNSENSNDNEKNEMKIIHICQLKNKYKKNFKKIISSPF